MCMGSAGVDLILLIDAGVQRLAAAKEAGGSHHIPASHMLMS